MASGSTIGTGLGAAGGTVIGSPVLGAQIGGILGSMVKGKGSPHEQIWQNAPKYFYYYGSGVPGSPQQNLVSPLFLIEDGSVIPWETQVLDGYVRKKTGKGLKEIEVQYRKKGEKPTGDSAFYVAVVDPSKYKGTQVVNGVKYDGNFAGGNTPEVPTSLELPKSTTSTEKEKQGGNTMNKFFSTKVMGIPVWILIIAGIAAFFMLRKA